MTLLDQMALQVVGNMKGNRSLGPIFGQLIAIFLSEILPKLLENCDQSSEQIVAMAEKPDRYGRRWLKVHVRQTFGRRTAREMGDDISAATLEMTSTADPADIDAVYEQMS